MCVFIIIINSSNIVQGDTKKRELFKNATKIEEIQEKKFIDRNWTITACLLRDNKLKQNKLRGLSPRANYADRAATAGRRS